MRRVLSVAIPVRDGLPLLERTLEQVAAQRVDAGCEVELVVCDSGSRDGSAQLARARGATVVTIPSQAFSHGPTRNLLMERSAGGHVAFLTQDSAPADERWLARLAAAFELADDVALAFGPYRPRPDASPMVARELIAWFDEFSPTGALRIDRLAPAERELPAHELLGPRGFFTDANGIVSRAAWEEIPYRAIAYAEDHALAIDMLRAGYAKAYVPDAAVVHSHEYSLLGWLRRSRAEARALHAVYGYVEPARPRTLAAKWRGLVAADWRWAAQQGLRRAPSLLARSGAHHAVRIAGAVLGSRR